MRRAVVALAVLLALAPGLGGPLVSPAAAAPPQAPPAGPALTVFDQTPWVGQTGIWRLTLKVSGAPAGGRVVTRVYDSLTSRESFRETLTGDELRRVRWSDIPAQPVELLTATADGNRLAQVDIVVDDGGLLQTGHVNPSQFGVYPVEVRVEAADGSTAARLVTHLVRFPDLGDEVEPLRAATLVPITAPPALQGDGQRSLSPGRTQDLAGIVQEIAAHPSVPLTLLPTPETLVALAAAEPAGDPQTLDRLRSTVAADPRQVLNSTYVPVDQPAWVQAGLSGELGLQRFIGGAALGDQLGVPPDGGTQVADPDLTPRALAEMQERGVVRVVVPERSLVPLDQSVTRTLTRPFYLPVDGQLLEAAQIDPGLRSAFLRSPDDPALRAHELLAELAMIFYEAPAALQAVVVAPPPGAPLPSAFLGPLLDGLATSGPILSPVTLNGLFVGVPLAGENGQSAEQGPRLVRAVADNSPPALGPFPDRLRQAEAALASYRSLLVEPSAEADSLGLRLLSAGSSDLTAAERLTRLGQVTGLIDQRLAGIVVPESQTVTLTSRSGQVPLTVRNDLDVPTQVLIEVSANNRLEFPDLAGQPRPETIPAGGTLRIPEQVRARGSGVVPVTVTVRTPDGRVLGATRYRVQSTAVSGVGLFITIAAAAFLAIWWARHWRRSRAERLARRASAASLSDAEDRPLPVG